jgi:hypothetical protein
MAITGGSRTLKLSILADVANLNKSLKQGESDVSSFTGKLKGFSDKISTAFKVATAAAVLFAGKIAVDSIKAASDLGETISKVGVLFGESSKEIEKFANGAAQSLGQTKQQALDAAANFAIFGKSAGLSGQALVSFSTDFVSLAGDLASFNNVSQDDAINAIGSALRGEAEPLRRFGVLLDDATLKNAALELGLISTTKNALTPQQKVLAAQKVIYEQTSAAQGDFARTSDGLANQTKILTAELENTKLIIGEALLPLVLELATAFSTQVVPLIRQFAYGLTGKEGLNQGLTDSEKSAYAWGERLKSVIKTVVSLKDQIVALGAVIATVFVVSKMAAFVQGTILLITALVKAYNALKASAIVAGIASAFALNPLLGVGAVALAAGVLAAANALGSKGNVNLSGLNAPSTGAIPFASGFAAPSGKTPTVNVGSVLNGVSVPSITSPTTATSLKAASKAATVNQPFKFGTSGVNTNTLAGIAAASGQPSVVINVNSPSIIDEEGFTRALNNAQNNSFFRGTGGATNLVGI